MGAETALLALAAGTGLKAFGEVKQGTDTSAVMQYNANVSKAEGQAAVQEAAAQEAIKRREVSRVLARQRLLVGTSGVGPGGTYEDAQADSASQGELDALSIRYGGMMSKKRAKLQAQLYGAQGKQAQSAGLLGALTTVATGAAFASSSGFTGKYGTGTGTPFTRGPPGQI